MPNILTVQGDEQLIAAFSKLGGSVARKYARKSVTRAGTRVAREMRRQIKAKTGRVTGNLRRSVKSVSRAFPKGKPTWVGRYIGPLFPLGAHAHLLDQGHRVVSHGKPTDTHTEGVEFLEPTFRATRREVEKELTTGIWKQIEADFRKTAKVV